MAPRNVVFDWEGKLAARSRLESPVPSVIVDEIASDQQGVRSSRLIAGDALDVARALDREGLRERVDLIYLDPPYGSGVDYRHEERVDGSANGRVATAFAYRDRWEQGQPAYLDMLYPRLLAMRPLLRATGSIWIQVDWRANYLVRMLCDEVFGRERFLNEIIWRRAPNLGRQARSGQFGRTYDSIIVYGKSAQTRLTPPSRLTRVAPGSAQRDPATGRLFTLAPRGDYTDASVARLENEGRVHRTAKGNVAIRYWLEADESGAPCRRQPVDALWGDIAPLRHAPPEERTGYPTQKPEALLARIVSAATAPGDVVVDLFAGSGTTGVAAARLDRHCVLGDASAVAVAVARSRLLRGGVAALRVERCGVPAGAATAQLSACERGDGTVELHLAHALHDEPIAWAVACMDGEPSRAGAGAGAGAAAPFRTHWHVERATGRSREPLPMSVVLPRAPGFAARVYFVSGRRADAFCTLATGPSPRTMIPLEETP